MKRIRILGIAPYTGMQTLMMQLASNMDDVELTAYVGDLEPGAAIAEQYTTEDFDVVLSRGGTAELIRKKTQFPVIDIEPSIYDILRSIQLAKSSNNRYAIVGFPAITKNASFLCTVLRYDVDLYTIHDESEARQALEKLVSENCPMVLCDMITNSLAREYGLPALLIISGSESVEAALRQAVSISKVFNPIKERALFLEASLSSKMGNAIAFNEDGTEIYRNFSKPLPEPLQSKLKSLCLHVFRDGSRRIVSTLDGEQFSINGQLVSSGKKRYAVFYIQAGNPQPSLEKFGIRYSNKEEATDSFFNSFYGVTHPGTVQTYEQYATSDVPLMIAGELGTGKDQMVRALYAQGLYRNNPLCQIDCALLLQKGLNYLLTHETSPLADTGITVNFQNIGSMSEEHFQQLFLTLRDTRFHKRNKIIFNFSLKENENLPPRYQSLLSWFGGIMLILPPLRNHREDIPYLTSLYISTLNMRNAREIAGIDPEALNLLKNYDWPANYDQFKRILNELVLTSKEPYISRTAVMQLLNREQKLYPPLFHPASVDIFHMKTLEEIEQLAVQYALSEEKGNQRATAARLGISRTTLWRILQKIDNTQTSPLAK